MKITILCKDPDGIGDCVKEAVIREVNEIQGVDEHEREMLVEDRLEKVWASVERWVRYQEYVKIEIDTDAGTARVVEQR